MKCVNCRSRVFETARYCPECGYPTDEKFNVTEEDFRRDTESLGMTEYLSPDSDAPMERLRHQGHEYLFDPESLGVWVPREVIDSVDAEAAKVVFENLTLEDQKYFNQAREHIKLKKSGMKSPVSDAELDQHSYKALVICEDYDSGGIWLDSSVISFWYAANQSKEAPALTIVEELLHILVHLKFLED